jgi:hypothetical protein
MYYRKKIEGINDYFISASFKVYDTFLISVFLTVFTVAAIHVKKKKINKVTERW